MTRRQPKRASGRDRRAQDEEAAVLAAQALAQWAALGVASYTRPRQNGPVLSWAAEPLHTSLCVTPVKSTEQRREWSVSWNPIPARPKSVLPLVGCSRAQRFPAGTALIFEKDETRFAIRNVIGARCLHAPVVLREHEHHIAALVPAPIKEEDREWHSIVLEDVRKGQNASSWGEVQLGRPRATGGHNQLVLELTVRTGHGTTFGVHLPIVDMDSLQTSLREKSRSIPARYVEVRHELLRDVPLLWGLFRCAAFHDSQHIVEGCSVRWIAANELQWPDGTTPATRSKMAAVVTPRSGGPDAFVINPSEIASSSELWYDDPVTVTCESRGVWFIREDERDGLSRISISSGGGTSTEGVQGRYRLQYFGCSMLENQAWVMFKLSQHDPTSLEELASFGVSVAAKLDSQPSQRAGSIDSFQDDEVRDRRYIRV